MVRLHGFRGSSVKTSASVGSGTMARSTRASSMQLQSALATSQLPPAPSTSNGQPSRSTSAKLRGLTHKPVVNKGHLTDEVRSFIIEKHLGEPLLSQLQIARWLESEHGVQVNRTTVGRIINKHAAEQAAARNAAEAEEESKAGIEELELSLYNWYSQKVNLESAAHNQTESLVAMSLGAFKEKVGELMATGDYKVPVGFAFTEKWLLNYMKRFGLQMAPLSNGTSESPENSLEPAETDSDNAFTKPSTWSDDLLLYLAPSNSTKSISNQEGYGEEYSNDAEMTDATDRPAAVSLKPDQESSAKLGASGRKSESSRRRTNALNVRGRGVQHLSDEIRTALVEKHEKNPDWSQTQLAAWLKNEMGIAVHRATIGRNLRRSVAEKAEETSDSANATSKKTVNGHLRGLADLEEALHEWIKNERRNGTKLMDTKLMAKAQELSMNMLIDVPISFSLSKEWKDDFKKRYSLSDRDDGGGSLQQDVSQSAVSPYPDPSPSNGASVMPSMPDVHRSVNTIRYFVYSADYDQDTKRELLQGLDDIYIKLGEANKRTEFATNHKIERT